MTKKYLEHAHQTLRIVSLAPGEVPYRILRPGRGGTHPIQRTELELFWDRHTTDGRTERDTLKSHYAEHQPLFGKATEVAITKTNYIYPSQNVK